MFAETSVNHSLSPGEVLACIVSIVFIVYCIVFSVWTDFGKAGQKHIGVQRPRDLRTPYELLHNFVRYLNH